MRNFLNVYGTGVLLAATGVGAGDLITSGLAGINFKTTLLWACVFGAALKYFLNEGLARYQMATNETIITGWITRISPLIKWPFLIYLILWSYFVGGALINACAVATSNIFQLTDQYQHSKIIYGILHSVAGLLIVRYCNFAVIEKIMSAFIFTMFCSVIVTAAMIFNIDQFSLTHVFVPIINSKNLTYSIAVLGGVGGTLTVLSYSYWLIEKKRQGQEGLSTSRKDLALAYTLTALFSMAMIIIGSELPNFDGPKSMFPVYISNIFAQQWGVTGKYLFLIGFWNGVFSSLLGVWQSVPYLYADFIRIQDGQHEEALTSTKSYQRYLYFLALVPISSLWFKFEKIQLAYAVIGALFMPLLALSLIVLTNKAVMKKMKSTLFHNLIYLFIFICFLYFGFFKLTK